MKIYQVAIADDHEIFRRGLRLLLNEINHIKVMGEATNGLEIVQLANDFDMDIIFMDIKMPNVDGIAATHLISQSKPNIKIIALTMFNDVEYFHRMVTAGAVAFLLKNVEKQELELCLERVINDENYFSTELFSHFSSTELLDFPYNKTITINEVKLSKKEYSVLTLICKGFSNLEIADMLALSERTIEGHRCNLINKTKTKNSIDLAMWAVKNRIVTL